MADWPAIRTFTSINAWKLQRLSWNISDRQSSGKVGSRARGEAWAKKRETSSILSHVSRIVTLHFKLQNLSTKSGYETCLKRNREILLKCSSTIQKVGILFLKGILMLCEYKLLRPCTRRALWLTFFHARHSFHLWLWVIWEAKVWTLISLCYAATLNSWKMYKPLYWQSTKWLQ